VQNYYNEIDRPHVVISLLTSSAKSPTGKLLMSASNTFLFLEHHGEEPRVIHEMWDNNMHLMKFAKKLKEGQAYRFSIAGSSITSAHHDDPLNEAERLTIYAKLEGRERLLDFHRKGWEDLWKSDIQISRRCAGAAGCAQHVVPPLLFCTGRHGFVAFTHGVEWPWVQRPRVLGYRTVDVPGFAGDAAGTGKEHGGIPLSAPGGCQRNAFSKGFKGAMFPWESADTGVEETPVWALSGPFEHHITADVAIAAWNYYAVTQDKQWLRDRGWPILSATADFWASRVERNGPGRYDIKNVVAADEWAENVDNNAFTNAAAKANLQFATQAAAILGIAANPDWLHVAQNIPVLKMENGVTQEHATYKGEGIKQADVNLLAYPLKEVSDPKAIQRDLEYYETRVPNEGTPAMTQGVFALLYSRIGNRDKALHWFRDAYIPNLLPPFRVIAETKGGTNPYFATGAGGILQAVIMGFGGVEITPSGLTQVKTVLPKGWTGLTITGVGPQKKTFTNK
jgi:trehalose/maltose hydrolase-like predicted phosphorylase